MTVKPSWDWGLWGLWVNGRLSGTVRVLGLSLVRLPRGRGALPGRTGEKQLSLPWSSRTLTSTRFLTRSACSSRGSAALVPPKKTTCPPPQTCSCSPRSGAATHRVTPSTLSPPSQQSLWTLPYTYVCISPSPSLCMAVLPHHPIPSPALVGLSWSTRQPPTSSPWLFCPKLFNGFPLHLT